MKKVVGIFVLVLVLSIPIFALIPVVDCQEIDATPAVAGAILDWCNDVTCRKCVDVDPTGNLPTIYTTECWANC